MGPTERGHIRVVRFSRPRPRTRPGPDPDLIQIPCHFHLGSANSYHQQSGRTRHSEVVNLASVHGPDSRLPRLVLLLYVATLTSGIGVVFALLAQIQSRYGFPTWSLGLLAGIPFAMTLFGNLWLAPLADRGWELRMIAFGCGMVAASLLWMVFATTLWQWVAARALMGLAEGISVNSARRIMLSWNQDSQGRALSQIMVAVVAGILLGPPLGGALNQINFAAPFLVPAGAAVLVLFLLPIIKPGKYQPPPARLSRRSLMAIPGFASGLMLGSSNWLYVGVIDTIWARYMTDLGAGPLLVGIGFVMIALPSVVFLPLSGRLADRTNPIRLALIACLLGLPLLAAYGLAGGIPALLVIGALHSTCWAFLSLPAQAAVAKVAPPGQTAEAQGMVQASGLTLAAVGAFAAAPLYELGGRTVLFVVTAAAIALLPMAVLTRRDKWRNAF